MNSSTKRPLVFGIAFFVAWIVIALVSGGVSVDTLIQGAIGGAAFGGTMFAAQKI